MDIDELADIIEKIKRNDQKAYKKLFQMYYSPIYQFLYRFTFNEEAAKDLTQDTFIKFWLSRQDINSSQYPKAYLYKIAKNLALNYNSRTVKHDSLTSYTDGKLQNGNHEQYSAYEKRALLEDLEQAITRLPEKCRLVFILSRYDGMKYQAISEVLEISLQTVKNHMSKALSLLRQMLSAHSE